jgi:hypothetical protein
VLQAVRGQHALLSRVALQHVRHLLRDVSVRSRVHLVPDTNIA